jgi:beta-fructofuranosidase
MIQEGEVLHSFYLSRPRPGAEDDPDAIDWIGHAISRDLINWDEQAPAIPPGPPGSLDDMKPWTGHIFKSKNVYYLYYTGRSRAENGGIQRTMLATSPDLFQWQKHPQPVMVADSRWYVSEEQPNFDGTAGWRDPVVVLDQKTGWHHAFLASYVKVGEVAERGCVAHARSKDLKSWEILEPAFAPHRYATIEVPDVFFLNGRWYLTLLTGTAYGNARGSFSDPNVAMGTIFAVSDSLDVPFRELDENVLIGGRWWEGTSCRSVEFKGVRYLFYFQCERKGDHDCGEANWGVLTTPKVLTTSAEGYLRAKYSPLLEQAATASIIERFPDALGDASRQFGLGRWEVSEKSVVGSCASGWSTALTETNASDFILTIAISVVSGRSAGVLFHADGSAAAYAVLLDFQQQVVVLTRLREFDDLEARSFPLEYDRNYILRLVCKGTFYEVYVDEVLLINCVRYSRPDGELGLIVEQGEAVFQNLNVIGLAVV